MNIYNFISLGENCGTSMLLKNAKLRLKSYPFDWTRHIVFLDEINVLYNIKIIKRLLNKNIDCNLITKDYLGDAMESKFPIHKSIWFPHETGSKEEVYAKYERRFERLREQIYNSRNIFVIIVRLKKIDQNIFDEIIQILQYYNKENKIIYICGKEHKYLETYKKCVFYKHIPFNLNHCTNIEEYDKLFFPQVEEYINNLIKREKLKAGRKKNECKEHPHKILTPSLDATPDPFRHKQVTRKHPLYYRMFSMLQIK